MNDEDLRREVAGATHQLSIDLKNSGLECLCDGRRECLHHPLGERCKEYSNLNVSPYFCSTCHSCRAAFVVWNLRQNPVEIPDRFPIEWWEELQT